MNSLAEQIIESFAKKPGPGKFRCLDREKVAYSLSQRAADPAKINQAHSGLCPSAAVVYTLARTRVIDYVRAVADLFDFGKAQIGNWIITPCDDLLNYKPPASAKIAQADWIIMASIRDSENWFIDYQAETDNGGAWGNEVADWLKKAGYTEVIKDWNMVFNKTSDNLKKAADLFAKDYQVCLLIDSDLLKGKTALISKPNHWVVLASDVETAFTPTSDVKMKVFTWGTLRALPDRAMKLDDFIDYYYGYVAAKY